MTRNTGVQFVGNTARKKRVRLKAKEFGLRVAKKDIHITRQPAIVRVCRAVFIENGSTQRSSWHARNNMKKVFSSFRSEMKHRKIIMVERAWGVWHNEQMQYWQHLEYAQAERDALNYHYARYLMTRGTEACGL